MNESHIDNAEMVKSLFANATEGIILANREGIIVLANRAAFRMFGYEDGELIGKKIEALLPPSARLHHNQLRESYHANPVNKAMGAGRDLFACKKDGSVFPVEISLSYYRYNNVDYVIAFVIDITVRKHNEEIQRMQREELYRVSEEVKLLNTELEQKVEDRTMMLRETLAQLERSKNELETALEKEKELSDLKTRFVSTVSHEFRTPLATVLSSASLLAKYEKTEEQSKREKHVARIKESIKHLNDMLEDLLSLGKLEEGLIEAKLEEFDYLEFIQDFILEMQLLAKSDQKILHIHDNTTTVIKSDKRLLRNILLNLVSNAIKFSPENSVVRINSTIESGKLIIGVTDSGIGISEEDCQHLFERFFRARNAQNIQGTGLGLHIVSKYLELLQGNITLQSEVDKGTTFTVSIPLS